MVLYLVRHGMTASNSRVIYAGRTDESVVPQARDSILALTGFLCGLSNICKIYSSPLQRTRDTAEPLSARLNIPIEMVPALTEMDVGPWSGLTGEEIVKKFPGEWAIWRRSPFDMRLDGFEDLPSVQARSLRWLHSLRDPSPSTVVFTHESVIKVILCALLDDPSAYRSLVVANCSVQAIESQVVDGNVIWMLRAENLYTP